MLFQNHQSPWTEETPLLSEAQSLRRTGQTRAVAHMETAAHVPLHTLGWIGKPPRHCIPMSPSAWFAEKYEARCDKSTLYYCGSIPTQKKCSQILITIYLSLNLCASARRRRRVLRAPREATAHRAMSTRRGMKPGRQCRSMR